MILLRSLSLFLLFTCCVACGGTDASSTAETAVIPEPTPAEPEARPTVRVGVNALTVRAAPNTDAARVDRLREGEEVAFTATPPSAPEIITLRGTAHRAPWREVSTPAGKTGWVYAGGLLAADAGKTLPLNDAEHLNFPYFGTYDLTEWEKGEPEVSSGGDATITETIYRRDNRELFIRETDVGEYGYSYDYVLRDLDGTPLLERSFSYAPGTPNTFEETIRDLTNDPTVERHRRLESTSSAQQLERPLAIATDWK